MADQTKNVNLNLKTSADTRGIDEVSKKVSALQDGVTSALLTLITTGSKMQAVFEGVKAAIVTKVLGPLGQFAGLSMGVLSSIKRLSAEFGTMGANAAGAIEMLEQQFRPLLKSMEAAKNRMAELRKFAKETPFGLNQVAEANKILENFTKGALSTEKGMTMVGDAAAVAGQELASVSMWVGRLYDGLQSGRPIGEAAFRLQEMGIFTGQARNAIEDMQASGASFSQMWRVVEMELGRASGGMEYTSKTLVSLQQQLEDTKDAMKVSFGEGFLTGEKAGIEAQIKAMELMRPAIEEWGSYLGKGREFVNGLKKSIVEATASIPGMSSAISIAGTAIAAFNTIIAAIAGTGVARMLVGIGMAGVGMKKAGTIASEASRSFSKFKEAAVAMRAMDFASAGAAASTAAVGASASAAGAAMKGLGTLARWAMSGIVNPASLAVAAIVTVIAAVGNYFYKLNEARKAHEAYSNGTKEMIDSMASFRAAIGTTQQLIEAYTRNMMALADAYRAFGKAQADGDAKAEESARDRIAAIKAERAELDGIKQDSLQKSSELTEFQSGQAAKRLENVDQAGLDAITQSGGGDVEARKRAYLQKIIEDQASAERQIARSSSLQESMRSGSARTEGQRGEVRASIEKEIATYEAALSRFKSERSTLQSPEERSARASQIANFENVIDGLKRRMADLGTPELDQLRMANESGDKVLISKAQIGLIGSYQSARESVAQAQRGVDALTQESQDAQEKRDALGAAKAVLERLEASIKEVFGSTKGLDRRKQELGQYVQVATEDLQRRADPNRSYQAQQEIINGLLAERKQIEEAILDTEERKARLTDNLVQGELDSIEIARQRVNLELEFGNISDEVANQRLQSLDEEARRIEDLAERRRQLIRDESELADMGLDAQIARSSGDVAAARALEEGAAQKRADVESEQARLRVLAETGDEDAANKEAEAVKNRIIKEQAARAKQEAEQMQRNAEQRNASLKASELERQATIAAANGQNDRAAALREAAKRAEEEASKGQRVIEAMQQYGVSREEATKMVDQEIESARKTREQEEQIRRRDQERTKENTRDEDAASDAESKGNTRRASRIRRKARERNRRRELMDEGFSEDEAGEIAKSESKREKRKEWADRYQAAAEAFFKFIEELKAMQKKIREYNESMEVKKLRASGRGEEADNLQAQMDFEKRVEELQREFNTDQGTAQKMAQEEERVANQQRQLEIQQKVDALNEELRTAKGQGMRAAMAESASTRRINAVNAVRTEMTSIGGSSLGQMGIDTVTSDTSAIKKQVDLIKDILERINLAQQEKFVVHSVRPKDERVGLVIPGRNGPNKIYV